MDVCKILLFVVVLHSSVSPATPETFEASHYSGEHLLHYAQLSDLGDILYNGCALMGLDATVQPLLIELSQVFQNDGNVFIGHLMTSDPSTFGMYADGHHHPKILFYPQEVKDRSCLLVPPKTQYTPEVYRGELVTEMLVQYINKKCGTHRTAKGNLNLTGLFLQHIINSLYEPDQPVSLCKRITVPDSKEFLQEYLLRSRPVVIEDAVRNWPAVKKWTMDYFHSEFGNREIHIKLTPDGIFEGAESAMLWEDFHDNWMPDAVKSQLPFPDLVIVRPATSEMKFSDFLDLISSGNSSYSAYLEYSSIPYYMPRLQQDIAEMPFVKDTLELRHLNMWLSDGNTLGKLHFDPFDNFLCQLSGEKHLVLFDPYHNENLYEAHIPEAILSFNPSKGSFHRRTLLQSTSMVMSPIDIVNPDLKRFPNFAKTRRLECVLRPGDVLFMPAFWWHEVQSHPDTVEKRNLAVNFWYEPVFTKEFPCAECRLKFNLQFYSHLLGVPPQSA